MPTLATYYLNNTVWASGDPNTATVLYTDSDLSTTAPNGWYKDNNNVYREVTGGSGALGTSAACTTCGTAFTLGYGASAFAACCSGTTATFYLDASTFAAANNVWSNPLLTTFAANQFYSFSSKSREKTGNATDGSDFSAETNCATCFPAVGLQFGSTATIGCCTGTSTTYYMNQPTFAASTVLYTNASGTAFAPAGFYALITSGSSVYKEVTGSAGSMPSSTTTCSACATAISLCKGTSADDVCCTGCATFTNFSGTPNTTFNGSCTATIGSNNYWHNGSGSLPVAGDTVFTNSGGTTTSQNGHFGIDDSGTRKIVSIAGGNGVVASVAICAP